MESVDHSPAIGGLIGESDLMREVRRDIEIAANLDLSVLIIGEPGTGKELIPRSIHDASGRRGRPFVTFNCVGLNSDLIERELLVVYPSRVDWVGATTVIKSSLIVQM